MKGVIFDLDGVLVSTDEFHYRAWKRLAEELGIKGFGREDNVESAVWQAWRLCWKKVTESTVQKKNRNWQQKNLD